MELLSARPITLKVGGRVHQVLYAPKSWDSTTLSHVRSHRSKILHILDNVDSALEAIRYGNFLALLAENIGLVCL